MPLTKLSHLLKKDCAHHHQYTEHEKKDVRSIVLILSVLIVISIFFLIFAVSPDIPTGEKLLDK